MLAMECVKHGFISYEMHFRHFRKHDNFMLRRDIKPFQGRALDALQYIEGFFNQLKLKRVETGASDTHKVISYKRLENKNSTYKCVPIPDLEHIL